MVRMTLLISILLLFSLSLSAPIDTRAVIIQPEAIQPYEALFNITCKVESSHRPNVIGDHGESFGIAQIQQIRLDDYFNLTGISYTTADCFNVDVSREIFLFFADRIGPYNMEAISRCWNGGPNGMNMESTEKYYLKVQKALLSL